MLLRTQQSGLHKFHLSLVRHTTSSGSCNHPQTDMMTKLRVQVPLNLYYLCSWFEQYIDIARCKLQNLTFYANHQQRMSFQVDLPAQGRKAGAVTIRVTRSKPHNQHTPNAAFGVMHYLNINTCDALLKYQHMQQRHVRQSTVSYIHFASPASAKLGVHINAICAKCRLMHILQ